MRGPSFRGPGRGAWRRWSVVIGGIVLLGALPAVIAALPVPPSPISAPVLRARILASASVPYEGYAESTVNLGLPELPDLHNVSLLLDGTTDQYVWYRSPAYWRADDVTGTGESDVYADGGVTYLWTYGTNLLTQVTGAEPVRLPRAPDLLPPALARRLLDTAGRADRISRLPTRRIAGVNAAGLRVVPTGTGTTIGSVEIWADPSSGLPVEVRISSRGTAAPVLTSMFLELGRTQPDLSAVTPHPAPDVGLTTTRLPDVDGVLNGDGDGDHDGTPFPSQLGGLRRVSVPGSPPGVAIYGTVGQLHAAAEALASLEIINQPLAAIAKREEIIYVFGQEDEPVALDHHSPVLHLVQLIRDEAHRFAVTFHRKRRQMRDRSTELLNIPGVGERTTRRLLEHFGSLQAVKQADVAALSAVVTRVQAEAILEHFRNSV